MVGVNDAWVALLARSLARLAYALLGLADEFLDELFALTLSELSNLAAKARGLINGVRTMDAANEMRTNRSTESQPLFLE